MPDPPQSSGPRWRRVTAGVLLGLAILSIILAPVMLYARTQLLDSSSFQSRAEKAIASADVQAYITDALTANLVARGGDTAQRAEPLVHSVVDGIVSSERFQETFGKAVGALHAKLISGDAGERVINLRESVDQAVDAIAVVSPELAQRIQDARSEVQVGQGVTGKRLAQIAERAHQLRVLGIILPILAFVLIALSIAVHPDRLRATRRAGWGLIAGGVVVTILVGLTRRVLVSIPDQTVAQGAVGEAENALLATLGNWGAWVTAIGVVTLATAVFLGSTRTLPEHAARLRDAATTRPAGTWALVVRIVLIVVVVLVAIFALSSLLTLLVAVVLALLVAYGVAELLRAAGFDPSGRDRAAGA